MSASHGRIPGDGIPTPRRHRVIVHRCPCGLTTVQGIGDQAGMVHVECQCRRHGDYPVDAACWAQ